MKKNVIKALLESARVATKVITSLSPKEKSKLEKAWDIEHAYYSSALEGSKIDRNEFERLAKTVK